MGRLDTEMDNSIDFAINTDEMTIHGKGIGGVELSVSGDFNITGSNYDIYHNNSTILIISLEGRDITDEIFSYSGNINIEDMIISNWNGEEVSVNMYNVPGNFQLDPAYPNPFNPATTISYSVPYASNVSLAVYDVMGHQLEILVNENMNSGVYTSTWNAVDYSSGVYYVKMKAGNFNKTQKILLMK